MTGSMTARSLPVASRPLSGPGPQDQFGGGRLQLHRDLALLAVRLDGERRPCRPAGGCGPWRPGRSSTRPACRRRRSRRRRSVSPASVGRRARSEIEVMAAPVRLPVASAPSTPRNPASVDSPATMRSATALAMSIGMAKPMPRLPVELPPPVAIESLMPMTRPVRSARAPPELPRVDRGVGLDGGDDAAGRLGRAADGADDAGGDALVEAERAADGDGGLADLVVTPVARVATGMSLGRIDLDDGDVGRRVLAEDLARRALVPSAMRTSTVGGAVDHVGGGQDQAARVVDEAGAEALARSRSGRRPGPSAAATAAAGSAESPDTGGTSVDTGEVSTGVDGGVGGRRARRRACRPRHRQRRRAAP